MRAAHGSLAAFRRRVELSALDLGVPGRAGIAFANKPGQEGNRWLRPRKQGAPPQACLLLRQARKAQSEWCVVRGA
jgi:hypothetical protein